MSLIYNVKPFLDLGICKEYFMARKTTESGLFTRRKKTETTVPTGHQDTELSSNVSNDNQDSRTAKPLNPVPINHHALNQASNHQNSVNSGSLSPEVEAEIRHRAYELYLQRSADVHEGGDQHQDWLKAEREVLSRHNSRERKSA